LHGWIDDEHKVRFEQNWGWRRCSQEDIKLHVHRTAEPTDRLLKTHVVMVYHRPFGAFSFILKYYHRTSLKGRLSSQITHPFAKTSTGYMSVLLTNGSHLEVTSDLIHICQFAHTALVERWSKYKQANSQPPASCISLLWPKFAEGRRLESDVVGLQPAALYRDGGQVHAVQGQLGCMIDWSDLEYYRLYWDVIS